MLIFILDYEYLLVLKASLDGKLINSIPNLIHFLGQKYVYTHKTKNQRVLILNQQ